MRFLKKTKQFALLGVVSALCASTAWANFYNDIEPIPTRRLPVPTQITHGSKIFLDCGTTYYGALELSNFSNVNIETRNVSESCGRAVITPAVPVQTWKRHSGNVWVADVEKPTAQVLVDSQLTGVAHYPNSYKESGWIHPTRVTETTVEVPEAVSELLRDKDVVGAQITSRGDYPWAIGTRTVTAFDGKKLTLPLHTNADLISEDSINLGRFYLEGKLWMLDSPGEWAWENGKLYLWMPDSQAPGNRVLAAPNAEYVVNARGTTNLTLKNIRLVGAKIGVQGGYSDQLDRGSDHLQIYNTEIAFSNWIGVYASEAKSLTFDGSVIFGALRTGIYSRTQATKYKGELEQHGAIVRNSRFINVNFTGMRKGSDGTIYLNAEDGSKVLNNHFLNSGKAAIFMGESRNSLVKENKIYGACKIHGDCGGIYVFSRGEKALNTRIEGNLIRDVTGDPARPNSTNPERYGIYLDDYATGVNVIANTIENADTGMQLHLAFNNQIKSNLFINSARQHVLLSEGGGRAGSMRGNFFDENAFRGPSLVYYFAVKTPTSAAAFVENNYGLATPGVMVHPANVPIR